MIVQEFLIWLRHALYVLPVSAQEGEQGQSLVEYALLMVLIGLIVVGMLVLLGPAVRNMFEEIVTSFGTGT